MQHNAKRLIFFKDLVTSFVVDFFILNFYGISGKIWKIGKMVI